MSEFRRRLMAQVASDPNALPVGCVRLEYIEGTGAQWINTQRVVSADEDIVYDFQFNKDVYPNNCVLIGWRWNLTNTDGYQFLINYFMDTNILSIIYGVGTRNGYIMEDNTTRFRLVISPLRKTITINGTLISSQYYDDTFSKPYGGTYPCYLFAFNNKGAYFGGAKGKLYEYSLIDANGNYTQHLIPILDPQGIPCMYDTIKKKFHYNRGTGTFKIPK